MRKGLQNLNPALAGSAGTETAKRLLADRRRGKWSGQTSATASCGSGGQTEGSSCGPDFASYLSGGVHSL